MANPELDAGQAVQIGDVGRAVVGHDALDGDVMRGEERDGAAEEPDGGDRLLVVEDLRVGQARMVIDGDVDVLPARGPLAIGPAVGLAAPTAGHAMSGAVGADPSELLDVDMQQL